MKNIILLICLVSLCSCGKKLSEKIIGKWEYDKESMTEVMKKKGKTKEEIARLIDSMGKVNLEITETKIKVVGFGEETEIIPYTVISEKDGVLKLKLKNNEKDQVSLIKFIDDDKIEVLFDETDKDYKFIFKRKK